VAVLKITANLAMETTYLKIVMAKMKFSIQIKIILGGVWFLKTPILNFADRFLGMNAH
jgi:hypothetical protein